MLLPWLGGISMEAFLIHCKTDTYPTHSCGYYSMFILCMYFRLDGIVVAKEFEQTLLDAWEEQQEELERKAVQVLYLSVFCCFNSI